MSNNIGKNISKNLSSKCCQKLLHHAKYSAALRTTKIAADAHKTASKRATQKITQATSDLNGNKIVDKITKVSRTSPKNSSETVTNETESIGFDRKIPKKRYTFTENY